MSQCFTGRITQYFIIGLYEWILPKTKMIPTYYVYKLFQEHLKHVKCYPRADIFTHVMHVTNIMSGVWGAEYTKPDISVTSEMLSSLREGHCCPFSRNKRMCGQIWSSESYDNNDNCGVQHFHEASRLRLQNLKLGWYRARYQLLDAEVRLTSQLNVAEQLIWGVMKKIHDFLFDSPVCDFVCQCWMNWNIAGQLSSAHHGVLTYLLFSSRHPLRPHLHPPILCTPHYIHPLFPPDLLTLARCQASYSSKQQGSTANRCTHSIFHQIMHCVTLPIWICITHWFLLSICSTCRAIWRCL